MSNPVTSSSSPASLNLCVCALVYVCSMMCRVCVCVCCIRFYHFLLFDVIDSLLYCNYLLINCKLLL